MAGELFTKSSGVFDKALALADEETTE